MSMQSALTSLQDVAGVHGSFIINSHGTVVAKDLPAMFEDSILTSAGERTTRLCEAFASMGIESHALTLRFAEHKLHVRAAGTGRLCVLSAVEVNGAALKMALNLVAKRVSPLLETPHYDPTEQTQKITTSRDPIIQSEPIVHTEPMVHSEPSHSEPVMSPPVPGTAPRMPLAADPNAATMPSSGAPHAPPAALQRVPSSAHAPEGRRRGKRPPKPKPKGRKLIYRGKVIE